ncbi:MAG: glycosyltransferase family 4 protein [Candidatus Binatia bacterium]
MKFGIDATVTAQTRIVGISRFVVNLIRGLAAIDPDGEYYLFYRPRALKRPHRIWRPRNSRFHIRLIQEPFNRRLFRTLDAYHATYQRLPAYDDLVPYLGSLHDIFYLSRPDMGSRRTRERWQRRYRDVAQRSRLIMTLSEFSKNEIVRLLGIDAGRVRVVPLAPSPGYVPQDQRTVAFVRRRYRLTQPYILFGGGFGRRKNLVSALRAFALALPRLPADMCFGISGGQGPTESEARAFVRTAGLSRRVTFLGFVPDADYPGLMTGSLLFFFPSLLEGFGLPVLEAMACGVPVVTSATTSLPEVCGGAARLIDPSDDAQMACALVELAQHPGLRRELRRAGMQRARAFTWRRVAETVLALYREVAEPARRQR